MIPRRLPALVAVAAAAVLISGCGAGDPRPPAAATAATPTRSTAPAGVTGWLDRLPAGPPPAIGYVIGHTYHSPDGGMVRLPEDRGITAITPLGDGYLVVDDRSWEGTAGVFRVDARGRRTSAIHTIAGPPALSPDGRTLRWITFTPPEVSRSEREPTRLHVADVASGATRTRMVHPDPNTLPRVRQRDHRPDIEAVLARSGSVPWLRPRIGSAAWEDANHLLLAVLPRGGHAAVVRLDTRTGSWTLAVDLMPLEGTWHVAFETTR